MSTRCQTIIDANDSHMKYWSFKTCSLLVRLGTLAFNMLGTTVDGSMYIKAAIAEVLRAS